MSKRLTTLALALTVLLLAATPAAAHGGSNTQKVSAAGPLRDLSPSTVDVTDGAWAEVTAKTRHGATHVRLRLDDLDASFGGQTFGAHVHSGSCIAGNGAAAGPHYNAGGGVSDHSEVWLDFTVGEKGRASSETAVEFTIPTGGASAVVIHAMATNHDDGTAGARLACLPVPF